MNNAPRKTTAHHLTSFPKLIPLLLVACLAIATGCRDDDPSRYPSVSVPGYEPQDYVADLSHPNPEIVFNAVCILTRGASDMGKTLDGVRTEPPTEAYRTAQAVHQKVLPLLQSRDPRLVAVSLRFLQFFGSAYKDKAGFVTPISQIQSPHPLVQFEQVTALTTLVTNTTQLPTTLLRRLLHSSAWMVSRASYQLINKVKDETLRTELLGRYPAASEEREKLLILSAFAQGPGPKAIELLQQELLTTSKKTIRLVAATMLASNLGIPGVSEWLATHYPRLSPEARHAVISQCISSNGDDKDGAELISRFLIQGYQPEEELMSWLLDVLKREPETLPDHLQRLEKAVRTSPTLGVTWAAEWQARAQARARFASLNKEFPSLAQEFTEKAKAMFAKHKIPDEKQQSYLQRLANLESLQP